LEATRALLVNLGLRRDAVRGEEEDLGRADHAHNHVERVEDGRRDDRLAAPHAALVVRVERRVHDPVQVHIEPVHRRRRRRHRLVRQGVPLAQPAKELGHAHPLV
jgi:hypothetical protein